MQPFHEADNSRVALRGAMGCWDSLVGMEDRPLVYFLPASVAGPGVGHQPAPGSCLLPLLSLPETDGAFRHG